MKKKISLLLSLFILLGVLGSVGCKSNDITQEKSKNVLRVASWDEYIDMGGSYLDPDPEEGDGEYMQWFKDLTGVDLSDTKPLYEEFEVWYKETYGKEIKVEYVALQDNETMYNKIKMGDSYDLLCPSEYMAMKLKAENRLLSFPDTFSDPDVENNYYAQNISPYTNSFFENAGLTGYIAGYMWGTTGFVFNPDKIAETPEKSREIMQSWYCLTSKECSRKLTAKDNVRDAYFMGLGMYYEEELSALKNSYQSGELSYEAYAKTLSEKMNDTSPATMSAVKKLLEKARKNLYGLETDEGKTDVIMGRLDASYQWSGDAVFILDEAEGESELELEYAIPSSASNLWFDGWVMMKGANVEAATAFINFLSMPQNTIRNMYYIGYTSCLAGSEIYDYVEYTYGEDEGVPYDLSYFFGEDAILTVDEAQTRRQLFAQYPDKETIERLVVMNYFTQEENERANRMWNNIK